MKNLISTVFVAVAMSSPYAAQATMINFDSGLDPFFGYEGVSLMDHESPNTGYGNMQTYTGSINLVFNPFEYSPAIFNTPDLFDLTSFAIAGAWGSQTLTINGVLDGAVVYKKQVRINVTPQLVTFNWSGINEFSISTGKDYRPDFSLNGSGRHWALDDITINENGPELPEPASIALFGIALAGLAGVRRKKS